MDPIFFPDEEDRSIPGLRVGVEDLDPDLEGLEEGSNVGLTGVEDLG